MTQNILPQTIFDKLPIQKRTIVFLRHGHSIWNEIQDVIFISLMSTAFVSSIDKRLPKMFFLFPGDQIEFTHCLI